METEAQRRGLGEYVRMGFTLEHDGATAVFLLHKGKLVGRFSQTGASARKAYKESVPIT